MPSYVFSGLTETTFPFDRDAAGQPVGTVQPGEVREFSDAPGWPWVPAGDAPAGDPEQPADADPEPEPGPQPAPPAVIPGS